MADDPRNSRERAEVRFQRAQKKQDAVEAGRKAKAEHDAAGQAVRDKTSRLKALRLAKEASDNEAAEQKKPAARKKAGKAKAVTAKKK